MKNNSGNKEIYLSLTDLLFYYMKRWKKLLIFAIVLSIIGGIAGMYLGRQSASDTAEEIKQYSISSSVKTKMDTAYQYQRLYDQQIAYTQESALMNLEFSQVCTGTLKYYISAGNHTSNYGAWFASLLSDSEIMEALKNVTGYTENSFVREMVKVSSEYPSATAADGSTIVSTESVIVTYLFYAPSSDVCQAMIDVVSEKGDRQVEALLATDESYSISNLEESVSIQMNAMIRDQQASNADLLSKYSSSLAKCTEDFTEKQQEYYDVVYLGREVSGSSTQKVSIKTVLLPVITGAFLGFLLWICCGFICYLLDKHVKYAQEMNERYGLKLIGRYCPQNLLTDKIEKWHENLKGRRIGPASGLDYFSTVLSLLNENICLIGKRDDEEIRELGEKIASNCEHIIYGNLMQYDSVTMQEAKESGKVVLLVHRGETAYVEVQQELEICSLQGIQVIGTIVLE